MAPAADGRDQSLRIRVSLDEKKMLDALAEKQGLTASDVVRLLVRREYSQEFGEGPPKKNKRK